METIADTIEKCFKNRRMNRNTHLGLGDIRLSIGVQEEIIDLIRDLEGVSSDSSNLLASGEEVGKGGTLFAGAVIARKKPVEIEAIQCKEPNDMVDVLGFCPIAKQSDGGESGLVWLEIPTLEGVHQAKYGDWIVKGVNGEFYPCKPDIFEQCYEIVGEANKVG